MNYDRLLGAIVVLYRRWSAERFGAGEPRAHAKYYALERVLWTVGY